MLIVAVDFDGTLCENAYPFAGSPNNSLLNVLRQLRASGEIELILWTCRVGDALDFAVWWCKEHGLEFDAVNENLPRIVERFGGDNRKIFANLYIDDCCADFSMKAWGAMEELFDVDQKNAYMELIIRETIKEKSCALRVN